MTRPKSQSQKVAASGFKLRTVWLQDQCYFPQWSVWIIITWKVCWKTAGFHPQFWDEARECWQVAKWSWCSGCAGHTLRTAGLNPDEQGVYKLGQVGQQSCSLSLCWTGKYANLLEKAPSSSRASPSASQEGSDHWPSNTEARSTAQPLQGLSADVSSPLQSLLITKNIIRHLLTPLNVLGSA